MSTAKRRNKQTGKEMFSVDESGKKVDAHIHEPILDNPAADMASHASFIKRMRERGLHDIADRFSGNKKGGKMKRGGSVEQTVRKLAMGGMSGMSEKAFIPHLPHMNRLGAAPHVGMIHSTVAGRTDHLPMHVKAGSYVMPADVVSGLGQGNSMAGANALNKMFSLGPYGTATNKIATPKVNMGHLNNMPGGMKVKPPGAPRMPGMPNMGMYQGGVQGGDDEHVPIVAAGGEYVIPPDRIKHVVHPDLKKAHDTLDHLVLHLRKKTIHETRKLKPPKKN